MLVLMLAASSGWCIWRRVRVSLGLKPLAADSNDRKVKEHEADAARRADAAKRAQAAELKERVDR